MLTILITSFNHVDYIIECIRSVQLIKIKKKIIIVDDCSTDGSPQIISEYINSLDQNQFENISFIQKKENRGVIDSIQLALSRVNTKYLYPIASDDIAVADGLERLIEKMESLNTAQFAVGGAINFFSNGKENHCYGVDHKRFFGLPFSKRKKEIYLNMPSPILSQSTIFKMDTVKKNSLWDSKTLSDDYAVFLKLFTECKTMGHDFLFSPEILCVRYRHHGKNSHSKLIRQFQLARQTIEVLAPPKQVDKAIAYRLSYFLLIALSRLQFIVSLKLLKELKLRQSLWLCLGIVFHILNRMRRILLKLFIYE